MLSRGFDPLRSFAPFGTHAQLESFGFGATSSRYGWREYAHPLTVERRYLSEGKGSAQAGKPFALRCADGFTHATLVQARDGGQEYEDQSGAPFTFTRSEQTFRWVPPAKAGTYESGEGMHPNTEESFRSTRDAHIRGLDKCPCMLSLHMSFVDFLASSRQYSEAVDALQTCVDLSSSHRCIPQLSPQYTAWLMLLLQTVLVRMGAEPQTVLTGVQDAVSLFPSSAQILTKAAKVLAECGAKEEAEQLFRGMHEYLLLCLLQ
jgi:hypothetical protein